jgi:alkaline phosphatase D
MQKCLIAPFSSLILILFSCQTKVSTPAPPLATMKIPDSRVTDLHQTQRNSVEFKLNIPYRSLDTSKSIDTFGFGSCNHQDQPQPLWALIDKNNPQLFIMMGDNVYASTKETKPIVDQYLKLNTNQDYRALRERIPFLAIWDDHDYGQNDGGFSNPEKDDARMVFLNYWGYLKQTLPKKQKALYHSRIIGKAPKRVQIILLDTRWDRSDLVKNPNYNPDDQSQPPKPYLPTTDKSSRILSEDQWKWLEDEIKKPAELKILVSSIQVLADGHSFEKWGNFPHEKERLLRLIKNNKSKNLIIFSGDRHMAALSKISLGPKNDLFEITGSALNRPSRLVTPEIDPVYVGTNVPTINFGLGKINWKNRKVTLEIHDADDKIQISQDVKF